MVIINIAGVIVKKMSFNSGENGGSSKKANLITWDGMTDQGQIASNSLYLANIIARDENRVLGKFKLTIYR